MNRTLLLAVILLMGFTVWAEKPSEQTRNNPKIYIAFLWHMHQPIYYPYENIVQTEQAGHYSFSLYEVHNSRTGPYTNWPRNAVQQGISANMPHFGAQVSFSGSLIENLDNLASAGVGFHNWKSDWNYIKNQTTSLGNPRLDMVGFGYHHPLMGLIDYSDIRRQIQWHRDSYAVHFPGNYSKGIFPPETAFSPRMIPALVDEGFEWVIFDNLHKERAAEGAPITDASGVLRPNRADVRHPNPNDWVQLNGLWVPSPVSAQWAHQARYISYTDPETGETSKIIGVPASRYLGEEDGRGGFGALDYDHVMSQLEAYNTDPDRPILIVLHHDGDNHGGGSEGYYNHNFSNFVSWLENNSHRFECTTIQDYLDRYPPPLDDVIHVQDGSWLGADGGDPQFKKWNGDPGTYVDGTPNYSPDRNSWGVLTAAKNIVETADQVNASDPSTEQAWRNYMNAQTSCYWYWDGTEIWDSNPTRGANLAVNQALSIAQSGTDLTPPSMYLPQRYPYNPGAVEWGAQGSMPSDFTVWTYVFDISGLESVQLKFRISEHENVQHANMIYTGGEGVGEWQSVEMSGTSIPSITNPLPLFKADEYSAEIEGYENVLIDYYVEAMDMHGNVGRSVIQHVWVGDGSEGGGEPGEGSVSWLPEQPTLHEQITITTTNLNSGSRLHWGVEVGGTSWSTPIDAYWPEGSQSQDGAIQTPFTGPDADGFYHVSLGPFNDAGQEVERINFVIKVSDDHWNNNNGNDFHIVIHDHPGDEPIGANSSVTTLLNESYTFIEDDFPFTGMGGAGFAGIKIESSVDTGDLKYNNTPVQVGEVYENVTLLTYTPPIDGSGNPLTQFAYQLKDSEGNFSLTAYTMSINVLSPNPISNNGSISFIMDEVYHFSEPSFYFYSPVLSSFSGVQIKELPVNGTLMYSGEEVVLDNIYSPSSLIYEPDAGEYGVPYTQFKFKVVDDLDLISLDEYTMTINVLGDFQDGVSWFPENPEANDIVTIVVHNDTFMSVNSRLHWGVNSWGQPITAYHPAGSQWVDGTGPAVQTPFHDQGTHTWSLDIGPFNNPEQEVTSLNFVLFYGGSDWNNNDGQDWHIHISPSEEDDDDGGDEGDEGDNGDNGDGDGEGDDTFTAFVSEKRELLVYPNPMQRSALIEIPALLGVYQIRLLSLQGIILADFEAESGETLELERNRLPSGVYFIQAIHQENARVWQQKLIISN